MAAEDEYVEDYYYSSSEDDIDISKLSKIEFHDQGEFELAQKQKLQFQVGVEVQAETSFTTNGTVVHEGAIYRIDTLGQSQVTLSFNDGAYFTVTIPKQHLYDNFSKITRDITSVHKYNAHPVVLHPNHIQMWRNDPELSNWNISNFPFNSNQVVFGYYEAVVADDVLAVLHKIQATLPVTRQQSGYNVHINGGTHGDESGKCIFRGLEHRDSYTSGVDQFIDEDIRNIIGTSEHLMDLKISFIEVSNTYPPLYPPSANIVINAWCYAGRLMQLKNDAPDFLGNTNEANVIRSIDEYYSVKDIITPTKMKYPKLVLIDKNKANVTWSQINDELQETYGFTQSQAYEALLYVHNMKLCSKYKLFGRGDKVVVNRDDAQFVAVIKENTNRLMKIKRVGRPSKPEKVGPSDTLCLVPPCMATGIQSVSHLFNGFWLHKSVSRDDFFVIEDNDLEAGLVAKDEQGVIHVSGNIQQSKFNTITVVDNDNKKLRGTMTETINAGTGEVEYEVTFSSYNSSCHFCSDVWIRKPNRFLIQELRSVGNNDIIDINLRSLTDHLSFDNFYGVQNATDLDDWNLQEETGSDSDSDSDSDGDVNSSKKVFAFIKKTRRRKRIPKKNLSPVDVVKKQAFTGGRKNDASSSTRACGANITSIENKTTRTYEGLIDGTWMTGDVVTERVVTQDLIMFSFRPHNDHRNVLLCIDNSRDLTEMRAVDETGALHTPWS